MRRSASRKTSFIINKIINKIDRDQLKAALDALHARYDHAESIALDPVQFIYRCDRPRDREIAGLVAASLAYGRVQHIINSVDAALVRMDAPPYDFVTGTSYAAMRAAYAGFKHRFTTGAQFAGMLAGLGGVIRARGSLKAAFLAHDDDAHETTIPALTGLVDEIRTHAPADLTYLIPSPRDGSACKRLNLYLSWMVRRDSVSPGVWGDAVDASRLVMPVDTHVGRIGRALGLITRKSSDLKAALEITAALREIAPDDPLKYDFALTHAGIEDLPELRALLKTGEEG